MSRRAMVCPTSAPGRAEPAGVVPLIVVYGSSVTDASSLPRRIDSEKGGSGCGASRDG